MGVSKALEDVELLRKVSTMANKRARRVGLGMKPRQGVEVVGVAQEVPLVAAETVSADASAVEVQPEVVVEAVQEAVGGNSEGTPLGLEGVQNLESKPEELAEELQKGAIVAQNSPFGAVPDVPQEAFDTLAAMMKASEVLTGAQTVAVEMAQPFSGEGEGKPVLVTRENGLVVSFQTIPEDDNTKPGMISFEEAAKMGLPPVEGAGGYSIFHGKQYAIGVDAGIGEEHGAAVVIRLGENGAPDESVEELGLTTLGELPTGEYRATVRIAEGYTEGAKQQAESDGVSLEDWLTIQLNAYLEQWWFANGPR